LADQVAHLRLVLIALQLADQAVGTIKVLPVAALVVLDRVAT
jgi:hypothetical protein